ncbi:hypothetical protein CBR_g25845 [Chara braunii]|uniref:RRM domain-containing protein n=1 Tax=Chara braunii TaxID=69332 RepID=A0A388L6K2_CHABU|nr:hypothetical protein CBR_g25845 [Chara braunii]|eukprot:GBG77914.1 hypothetical protein CBR_g25845 [Chara braunii]
MVKVEPDGRSKGFGFINFKDAEVADKVLQQAHVIDGRPVELRPPKDKLEREMAKKVFVGNVDSSITDELLQEHFSKFGKLTDVFLPKPHRGYAFITFESGQACKAALESTNHVLNGVRLQVKLPTPKQPPAMKPLIQGAVGGLGIMGGACGFSNPANMMAMANMAAASGPMGGYGGGLGGIGGLGTAGMAYPGLSLGAAHPAQMVQIAQLQAQGMGRMAMPQVRAMQEVTAAAAMPMMTGPAMAPLAAMNPLMPGAVGGMPLGLGVGGVGGGVLAVPGFTGQMCTSCQLYVSNLPYSATWQDLKDFFKQFGTVIRAEILTDERGLSKGRGTVRFSNCMEATNALGLAQNVVFKGRPIAIKEDRQQLLPQHQQQQLQQQHRQEH